MEVRELLSDHQILGLRDIGCHEEIPEDGLTLDENSKIKAEFVKINYNLSCFADDTGLEVEALDGAPGVYSARYAGSQRSNEDNINLLLKNLETHDNRKARFRTVISLILDGQFHQFEGIVEGRISSELTGKQGFGYDPIFIPKGENRSFAQMTSLEKNAISHRGRAIQKLVQFLQK